MLMRRTPGAYELYVHCQWDEGKAAGASCALWMFGEQLTVIIPCSRAVERASAGRRGDDACPAGCPGLPGHCLKRGKGIDTHCVRTRMRESGVGCLSEGPGRGDDAGPARASGARALQLSAGLRLRCQAARQGQPPCRCPRQRCRMLWRMFPL